MAITSEKMLRLDMSCGLLKIDTRQIDQPQCALEHRQQAKADRKFQYW
jgi:hypothetical protein